MPQVLNFFSNFTSFSLISQNAQNVMTSRKWHSGADPRPAPRIQAQSQQLQQITSKSLCLSSIHPYSPPTSHTGRVLVSFLLQILPLLGIGGGGDGRVTVVVLVVVGVAKVLVLVPGGAEVVVMVVVRGEKVVVMMVCGVAAWLWWGLVVVVLVVEVGGAKVVVLVAMVGGRKGVGGVTVAVQAVSGAKSGGGGGGGGVGGRFRAGFLITDPPPPFQESQMLLEWIDYPPRPPSPFHLNAPSSCSRAPASSEEYGWPDHWDRDTINHYSPGAELSQYYSSDHFVALRLKAPSFFCVGFSMSAWLVCHSYGADFPISATIHHQEDNL